MNGEAEREMTLPATVLFTGEFCPRGTLFTGELCPGGQYSPVNNVRGTFCGGTAYTMTPDVEIIVRF